MIVDLICVLFYTCNIYFTLQLRGSETDDDVQVVLAVDEAMELLVSTGFRKPVSQLGMTDVEDVIMVLLEYHLFVKVKAEIDQFVDGLKTLGFLGCLMKNPSMWESFFLPPKVTLTPGQNPPSYVTVYVSLLHYSYRCDKVFVHCDLFGPWNTHAYGRGAGICILC